MDLTVKIYLSDIETLEITNKTKELEGFKLLQEMDSKIESIIAPISANELKITVSNLDDRYSLTNTKSDLYGKLKDGLKVEVVVDNYRIFTGYLVDYEAPINAHSSKCHMKAVDKLQYILNTDIQSTVQVFNVHKDTTLKQYLTQLFKQLGFIEEDIVIAEELDNIHLNFTVFQGKKLAEVLNDVSKAADCYIYISRTGKVIVKSKEIRGSVAVRTIVADDITDINVPRSLLSQYNTLKVSYVSTALSEVQKVLEIKGLEVEQGTTKLSDYKTEVDNLYELDNVKVSSNSSVSAEEVSCSQSTVSMSLYNSSTETDKVDIEVYGKIIETADAFIVKKDEEKVGQVGEKSIEVKSALIQDKEYAETLANKLWLRLQEQIPYITASVNCDKFPFDLCYIIRAKEDLAEIDYLGYVHSINYTYHGGKAVTARLGIKKAKEV